jgi:hypothetical protein
MPVVPKGIPILPEGITIIPLLVFIPFQARRHSHPAYSPFLMLIPLKPEGVTILAMPEGIIIVFTRPITYIHSI